MGDLISREALLEELDSFSLKIGGSANAMALVVMDETKKSIAKMIENQPTAFDLESVIQQIETEEKRQLIELEEILRNADTNHQSIFLAYNMVLVTLGSIKTLINSAANATNGKIRG